MNYDLFDAYLTQNHMYTFEGQCGVRNLNKITQDVGGYTDLEEFLEDNPGAIEAVISWIQEQNNEQWDRNLGCLVEIDSDEDDEE